MHEYVSRIGGRWRIYLALAVFSLLLAYGVHRFQVWLGVAEPWWLAIPSGLAFFPGLYAVFDKWLWKSSALRRIGLVSTPYLAGIWDAKIRTSRDEHALEHVAEVHIRQTWTRISIVLEGEDSRSSSLAASFLTENSIEPILYYLFRNEPRSHAVATMVPHKGATELLVKKGARRMKGEYFTGRGRETHGSIELTRRDNRTPPNRSK